MIPFNTSPDLPDRTSPRERVETFRQILLDAGLTATLRESRGWDISAACGMLRAESAGVAGSAPRPADALLPALD